MNNIYKEELFYHINSITLITALNALIKTDLINIMIGKSPFTIETISNEKKINKGYLYVTLRLLYSMGLLDFEDKNNELHNIFTIKLKTLTYFKGIKFKLF